MVEKLRGEAGRWKKIFTTEGTEVHGGKMKK
jgi:hypothetical protein